MIDSGLDNFNKLDNFLRASKEVRFSGSTKPEKYTWIKNVLNKFKFRSLKKKGRGLVRGYIQKMTGYSNTQMSTLILQYLEGKLFLKEYQRHKFTTKFSPLDIALLVTTDNSHQRLNGVATKKILEREYQIYGHLEYERISKISVSHLYNLRGSRFYKTHSLTFKHTLAVQRNIGERVKPDPQGKPGYIRIDTVHQGDLASESGNNGRGSNQKYTKGVYHINSVDEVTQWEIIASVEQISEAYLEPILKLIIVQYPFVILEFHADNGGEYINHMVANLLNKLLIKLTKSRSRQSNDNALVESKNGSIIRKHMGYFYINQKYAPNINDFYFNYFNTYLNFHRPCGFATSIVDKKGKIKKVYRQKDYLPPYDALKKIENFEQYLKPGVTKESLEKIAMEYSDNEYANIMDEEKTKLFDKIGMSITDF